MSLKEKTIRGFSWAFIDRFSNQIIQFAIGIILARLLTPREYGLVGMIAIFLAVSDTFIVTGFSEALIQKKNPDKNDYSTVFLVNIITGLTFYTILFFSAGLISDFFKEPLLEKILIVISLTIIINALGMVPRVPLVRNLNFKALTKISVIATSLSGLVAIILALQGFGVWSLVWRAIVMSLVTTIMVNVISRPALGLYFNTKSFRELFGFGSKLLVSRLINELYLNLYYLLIGKFFSARDLGLYTRANGYKDLPSRTLSNVVQSVSFPALSKIQDDNQRLKKAFRRLIQVTMFLTFSIMFCLAGAAHNFIVGLIGYHWVEAVPYLQLLCFVGIFYPLSYLNLNLMTVKGRSDMNLKVEIIRKLIALPIVVFCLFYGIMAMIWGLIIASVINTYITLWWSGKLIAYPPKEQITDIIPSFFIAISAGILVFLISFFAVHILLYLCLHGAAELISTVFLSNYFKLQPFLELKIILLARLQVSSK